MFKKNQKSARRLWEIQRGHEKWERPSSRSEWAGPSPQGHGHSSTGPARLAAVPRTPAHTVPLWGLYARAIVGPAPVSQQSRIWHQIHQNCWLRHSLGWNTQDKPKGKVSFSSRARSKGNCLFPMWGDVVEGFTANLSQIPASPGKLKGEADGLESPCGAASPRGRQGRLEQPWCWQRKPKEQEQDKEQCRDPSV